MGEQVQNTTDYERETSLGPRLDILPGIANGAMVQSQAVTIAKVWLEPKRSVSTQVPLMALSRCYVTYIVVYHVTNRHVILVNSRTGNGAPRVIPSLLVRFGRYGPTPRKKPRITERNH